MNNMEALENIILRPWQETTCTLDGVETSSETVDINISIRRSVSLEISINTLKEHSLNLEKLFGQMISILKTEKGHLLNTFTQDDFVSTVPQRRS